MGVGVENCELGILHPARITFTYENEIKTFTDKQKLRNSIPRRCKLKKKLLKQVLLEKKNDSRWEHGSLEENGE